MCRSRTIIRNLSIRSPLLCVFNLFWRVCTAATATGKGGRVGALTQMQCPKRQNYLLDSMGERVAIADFAGLYTFPIKYCAPFIDHIKCHGTYYERSGECQFYAHTHKYRLVHHTEFQVDPTRISVEVN